MQSFRDEELQRLSRLHSAAGAREPFAMARAAGFDNISLDLMMWLPQQTVAQWLESVDALIALGPDHASLYMLEIYPNAPLRDAMARGAVVAGARRRRGGDVPAGRWRGWTRAGYEQYEISNVARPGRAVAPQPEILAGRRVARLRAGAHSTRDGVRWKNVARTADYIASVAPAGALIAEAGTLSAQERLEDALFTGLRLNDGLSIDARTEPATAWTSGRSTARNCSRSWIRAADL